MNALYRESLEGRMGTWHVSEEFGIVLVPFDGKKAIFAKIESAGHRGIPLDIHQVWHTQFQNLQTERHCKKRKTFIYKGNTNRFLQARGPQKRRVVVCGRQFVRMCCRL